MGNLTDKEYQYICNLIYQNSRISLGEHKRELVTARLGKRLRATQKSSYAEYLDFLQTDSSGEELTHLVDAISTNHTYFFREIKHFEFMNETVLPWISSVLKKEGKRPARVWSAASSSGEEPYSVSITLNEHIKKDPAFDWELEATDISTRVLKKAMQGIYPMDRIRDVRRDLLTSYFQKGTGDWDGYYRVKEEIRNKVKFTHLNLLSTNYPFNKLFDVVFCRNVMIYFDRPTQEQLVGQIFKHLRPGGYLMIGHSESLTGVNHPFQNLKPAIYRKPIN
ncbi:MAG: protein-glutamate O-methyltransferase CheR [Verrucomicrobiota bacterium]